ncbi:alpha/beta hydrolase [Moraxella bovis]|uniref:alpha/beta hydrolase n=1 Tax=Moraxella bovis TaxID=476 RepID=UPI002227F831|nr:alpha/beta hydrolase [Moraxella bovis]UYZ80716.1 alpha/beta hydrolase [Moraxella bovis]UZA06708.1 alpha/beta hydrolase [Moraxella bovis]UZA11064.1 alpha/beta hydrolase [Moraxella bovis]
MKKFKTTTIALTFSALALALSACQTTPSSQTTTQSANTAIDQAIRANSKASTQHTKQMATANKLNHISYANVAYDNINERQKMDIYLPKNHRGNVPVVLYLHGGGFITGDKLEVMGGSHKNVEEMVKRLLDNGYAVVSVGYRFLPNALLDEISNNVTKAFEFVRKNSKEYGLESNRITVMGESAGRHLAQWLAVTQGKHIKASLPYDGSADFVNMTATTKAQPQCEATN